MMTELSTEEGEIYDSEEGSGEIYEKGEVTKEKAVGQGAGPAGGRAVVRRRTMRRKIVGKKVAITG